jgi:hypothetical protein
MSPEKAGFDPHWTHLCKATRHPQHLELSRTLQPIARLYLDHADTLSDQRIDPRQSLSK